MKTTIERKVVGLMQEELRRSFTSYIVLLVLSSSTRARNSPYDAQSYVSYLSNVFRFEVWFEGLKSPNSMSSVNRVDGADFHSKLYVHLASLVSHFVQSVWLCLYSHIHRSKLPLSILELSPKTYAKYQTIVNSDYQTIKLLIPTALSKCSVIFLKNLNQLYLLQSDGTMK